MAKPTKKKSSLVRDGQLLGGYVPTGIADGIEEWINANDPKIVTTELGRETVDGHPCVKNKVVVTDAQGAAQESTVWNATDLKNFPVQIIRVQNGSTVTMLFQHTSLAAPAATVFETPAGYTQYDSVQKMMQAEIMKKMGSGLPR